MELNKKDRDYLITHDKMSVKNGLNEKALWGSSNSQIIRFKVLAKLIKEKSNFSIIDFGAGLTHFYQYLIENNYQNFQYFAVELNPKFVSYIKNKKPNINIVHGEISKVIELTEKFNIDYIVSSGIYNLGKSNDEVSKIFIDEYSTLMNKVNIGLGANFLSNQSKNKDNKSIYHDPIKIINLARNNVSEKLNYFHDYLPHDFTLLMYK